jgi:hypothetical protein
MNENLNKDTSPEMGENVQAPEENVLNPKGKPKHKHSSALVAASKGRSAMEHVDPHRSSGLSSDFRSTGTNVSYEELL